MSINTPHNGKTTLIAACKRFLWSQKRNNHLFSGRLGTGLVRDNWWLLQESGTESPPEVWLCSYPSTPALSESTLQAPLIQHLCHLLCFQVFYLLSWSPSFNFTIINRLVFYRGLKLLPQSEVRSFSSLLLYLTFYSYFCLALLFYYHLHVYFRKI